MNPNQSAAQFLLADVHRRFACDCQAALGRVLRAQTMHEVVRAAEVHAPPLLRAIRHTVSEYRALTAQAERRLEELLEAQLKELRALPTAESCKDRIAGLYCRDWPALRGTYAHLFRRVEHEARGIQAKKVS